MVAASKATRAFYRSRISLMVRSRSSEVLSAALTCVSKRYEGAGVGLLPAITRSRPGSTLRARSVMGRTIGAGRKGGVHARVTIALHALMGAHGLLIGSRSTGGVIRRGEVLIIAGVLV